jgi:hypothetical protein
MADCTFRGGKTRGKPFLIRKATRLEIPRIMEIRAAVHENKLRDLRALPSKAFVGSSIIPAFLSGKRMARLFDFLSATHVL